MIKRFLREKNYLEKKITMRKRFLKWLIKVLLPRHHLAENPVGGGRRKKVEIVFPKMRDEE